jgi:outer membrane receptor protein involved in Fe transport
MRPVVISGLLTLPLFTTAQVNYFAHIQDSKTKEPLIGAVANVVGTPMGNVSDEKGFVLLTGVPTGRQVIRYKAVGYEERIDTIVFADQSADTAVIVLEGATEEMEEAVVSSTRSSRTIQSIPTRIELISGEELAEKANMKPGDIRMLLSESTGIQTLQTSATSGNSSIRIEGLDGRYTQLLKDGLPLYAGFSGGLGLLQTPPLDLKRVEIIKGASSTLYGGGAIAGLINLISKTPTDTRELNFLINGTSAKGVDVGGFYSERYGKIGLTLYGGYNANEAYAPGNTMFAAIPKFSRYTLNPTLFIYPSANTDIRIGVNASNEGRLGGDIHYILGERDSVHTYYEDNKSTRVSSQAELKHRFGKGELTLRNSVSYFGRTINTPAYAFDGTQVSTYSEVNYAMHRLGSEWIMGGNFLTDAFRENKLTSVPLRSYLLSTYGAFVLNTWDISRQFVLETGLRGDYVVHYGGSLLPKVSLLYKPTSSLSSRLGGGMGYKAPTIFTEESERIDYQDVLPVSNDSNKLERSFGGNWDINYRTSSADGTVRFSINQLIFYTHLNAPLELIQIAPNLYRFENFPGHIDAKGSETNIKLGYKHLTLFLGYTFTHSLFHYRNLEVEMPLTPRHHTNTVLMYEIEGKLKIGAEAYYYSRQQLSGMEVGRDYWLCGLMGEKSWKHVSLFINFENVLNIRQTRYGSIYTGSVNVPQFKDIYAPLDGFIMNGGVKLRL